MNQAPKSWQRIIAVPFALAVLAAPAWAGKFSFHSTGEAADAYFSSVDESGCVFTNVAVFTSESTIVFHIPPGAPDSQPSSVAEIAISQYDVCTGEVMIGANCFAEALPDPAFEVSGGTLASATLDTNVQCFDFDRGVSFVVAADVTWTGIGEVERQTTNTHLETVNGRIHAKFKGLSRSASMTGSVSDGSTNFIANATGTGGIRNDTSAEVIID